MIVKDNEVINNESSNITLSDLKKELSINSTTSQNPFPIEFFPKEITDFILDEEDSLNSDRNYLSASILSALSLAIGNSFQLEIKPTYVVKANLYIAIVGLSGTGKSHPMKKAYTPLNERQIEYMETHKKELKEWNENNQSTSKPTYKKLFLNDFTIEALMEVHSHNPMGIGVFADELLGWFSNMGRYNKGSDNEIYLSLWNGEPINVDRVSKTISVKSSFLNIFGGIQPGNALRKIINDNNDSNGFVPRILWINPVTKRFKPETDKEPNRIHFENYRSIINQILHSRDEEEATLLKFSKEAAQRLYNWRNSFRKSYHYSEEYLRAFSVKVSDYTNRFILILLVLDYTMSKLKSDHKANIDTPKVKIETVEKAIRLTEYLMESFKSLREEMNPTKEWTNKMKEWYKKLPTIFKTKEALSIAKELDISSSSVEKYLVKRSAFMNLKRGEYKKMNV